MTKYRCHLSVSIKDFLYATDELFEMEDGASLESRFRHFVKM